MIKFSRRKLNIGTKMALTWSSLCMIQRKRMPNELLREPVDPRIAQANLMNQMTEMRKVGVMKGGAYVQPQQVAAEPALKTVEG
jgi:hypothetical protein